jgi:hypothetical protein
MNLTLEPQSRVVFPKVVIASFNEIKATRVVVRLVRQLLLKIGGESAAVRSARGVRMR